jgi:7,8-dihydro-6-hydroxymethylpterin-pyrophosphokinase
MLIERASPFTGELRTLDLDVTQEQLDAWRSGTVIQHAMPHLSADEREFILTGILADEWDEMFGEEE